MALKALMISSRLTALNEELTQLQARDAEFSAREAELSAAIEEAVTEEERETVEAAVSAFDAEQDAHRAAVNALNERIASLNAELSALEAAAPPPAPESPVADHKNERMNTSMITLPDIRALPMSQRAFDALPMAQRESILASHKVQEFLAKIRSYKNTQASVTGAELTIPVEFLDIINENRFRYSKLMNRVRVRNVGGEARQTIAGTVPEAVWTEMCGAINELTFVFNQITTDGYKVAGFIPVCNSLLEDNDVNLASWIVEMLSESIGLAKDKAIIYGKGAASKMPLGIVTRLAQTSQPAGYPANAPAWTDLHTTNIIKLNGDSMNGAEFWSALTLAAGNTFTHYSRGEQFWAMNSKTYNYLKSKVITFTASGDIVANLFGTLPIINGNIDILEFMPDYDIVGGYGDLYLWAQRAGMTIEQSREVQFIQDNTVFKGKERADGQPIIPGAFVAINVKNVDVTTSMLFTADSANTLSGVLLPTSASVASGSTLQLAAVLTPFGIKGDVTWASATTAKATVSSTGLVTGVAAGSSVITATCGDYSASCTVTVTNS